MEKNQYDVIIVGAGPAGLSAGMELARQGKKILLIERKHEIGTPVRCGELTRKEIFKILNIASPSQKEVIKNTFSKMVLIDRNKFEKMLSREILRYKGELVVRSWAYDVKKEKEWLKIFYLSPFGEKTAYCKGLILAEGIESFIARKIGFNTLLTPSQIGVCYSWEMENISVSPKKIEMDFVPHKILFFYWIFPANSHSANVGVGVLGENGRKAKEVFHKFIQSRRNLKKGYPVREIIGAVPITHPLEKLCKDKILITGTSAHLIDPFGGEGIYYAVKSGCAAAKTMGEALNYQDMSESFLRRYIKEIQPMLDFLWMRYETVKDLFTKFNVWKY